MNFRRAIPALALVLVVGLPAVPAAAYAGTSPTGEAASARATAEVTNLRVRWPGAKVRQGRRYVVKGRVSGGARALLVQRRIPGGWFTLGRAKSAANGEFRIKVGTRWVARHRTIRVLAPATTTHDAAAVTRDGALTVTRNYRPRGGKAWKPIAGGPSKGQRWTPCGVRPGVITYRVNPKGLPRRGLREIRKAVGKATAATGFSFRYLGKTRHVPLKKGSNEISPGANLTIAYSTPRKVPALRGPVLATTPVAAVGAFGTSIFRVIEAGLVIDKTHRLRAGFGRGATRGGTLIHELGHVMGLDHVRDPRQMMYPSPTRHDASYAKGDLRGLKKVGVAAGCFPGEAVGRVSPTRGRVLVTIHR